MIISCLGQPQKFHIELIGPSEHLRVRQIRVLKEKVKSAKTVEYINKKIVDQNRNHMQLLDIIKNVVFQVRKKDTSCNYMFLIFFNFKC